MKQGGYGEGKVSSFQLHLFPFILESVHLCEIEECRGRKCGKVGPEGLFTVISIHFNLMNPGRFFPVRVCF